MPDEHAAIGGGKVTPILMPQAGNTMEEGTVISWRVKEGDQITVGQVICEIETDKATMDFESPDAGRLARIVAPLGEPVAVKELIAILADSDADADAYPRKPGQSRAAATPTTSTESHSDRGEWSKSEFDQQTCTGHCRRPCESIARRAKAGRRTRRRARRGRHGQRARRADPVDRSGACRIVATSRCADWRRREFAGHSRRCDARSASTCSNRSKRCRTSTCGRRSTPIRCWRSTANRRRRRTARSTT